VAASSPEVAAWLDVPQKQREELLKTYFDVEGDPTARKAFKRTKAGTFAEYDDFFDSSAVVGYATNIVENPRASTDDLRTAAAVLLRTTTFMRSGDLAKVLPQLYSDMGRVYVRYQTKNGKVRTVAIEGLALAAVRRYAAAANRGSTLMQYLDGSHALAHRPTDRQGGIECDGKGGN